MFDPLALFASLLVAAPQGLKLNGPLARDAELGGGDVQRMVVSPDGSWVAYLADQEVDGLEVLYSAPFDGSAPARKLSANERVWPGFQIGAGNGRVVYVDRIEASLLDQIHSAPIDGSAPPVRLNPNLPTGGDVSDTFALSPDGARIVYHADQAVDERFELWSVPSDGSAPAVRLNAPLAGQRDVRKPLSASTDVSFRITPDGTRVLYIADQVQDGLDELFSVPSAGGATLKLNGTLALGGNVLDFLVSPDGQWVVYRADQDEEDRFELYAVPVSGGVPPVRLNGAFSAGSDVLLRDYFIGSSSARVAYRADQDVDERFEAFAVAIDGSTPPVRLNAALGATRDVTALALAPGGLWAVYLADQVFDERFALFAVPLDASAAPVKLNPALPSLGDVGSFWFSADGARVVYWADQELDAQDELYSVPVAGGAPPQKLSGPLVAGGDVARDALLVTASGRVLFLADKLQDERVDLWSVPVDGSLAPLRLDANAQDFTDVSAIVADAAGLRAGFLADPWFDGQVELLGVPVAGGAAPLRLNGALLEPPIVGDVVRYAWSPDGRRVLYSADADADDFWELFSVKTGPVTPPVRLNDPALAISSDEPPCWFDPHSERIVFQNEFEPQVPGVHPDDDILSAPRDGSQPALAIGDDSDDGYFDFAFALPGGVFVYGQTQAATGPARTYHLWNAAIDGSRAPFELIPAGAGSFGHLVPSPQRDLVLCSTLSASAYTLTLVPVDGSAPGLALAGPLASLTDLRFSLAQDRVFFVGSFGAGTPDELWSVPVSGGAPQRLNPPLAAARDVDAGFLVTPDGTRLVYRADQDTDEVRELYAVPALGGASVKLSGPMTAGGSARYYGQGLELALSPDGARVVYIADQVTDGVPELFSAPVDGSAAAVRLNAALAAGRAVSRSGLRLVDGQRVVYVANQDSATSDELYLAPLDGSQAPVRLNPAMVAGGGLRQAFVPLFEVSDGRVLYVADQDVNETFELYSVPLDGSQGARRLSGALVAGGDVLGFALGASGRVVYLADQEHDGVAELFLVFELRDALEQAADSPLPATMVY